MNRAARPLLLIAVLALVAAACGGAGTAGTATTAATGATTQPGTPSPTATSPPSTAPVTYQPMPLDEAVAVLDDPDTAVQGVLGILDELNIGVYTADGTQVLAGSETGPDDLYVLAELLPGLAVSARRPGPTMEQYLAGLDQGLGTGLTPAELAAVYTVMTETLPDVPMSRVLKALDVTFTPDRRLTRFEAWLLTLVWVTPAAATARGSGPVLAAAVPAALYEVRCPATGDGSTPGYDLADQYGKGAADAAGGKIQKNIAEGALGQWEGSTGSVTKVAGILETIGGFLEKIGKIVDIAKAAQAALNVDFTVDTEPVSTHEVHTTQREQPEDKQVQITVKATFTGVTAPTEQACAFAGMLGLPDPGTPVEGAQVELLLDDTLAAHGDVYRRSSQITARASTDEKGEYIAWYRPKAEKPDSAQKLSDAFVHKAQGTYTVSVTWGTALGQLFNLFAGADWVLDILGLNEITGEITVGWHDPAAEILVEAPLGGFSGQRAYYLKTCDGETWTGAAVANGTLATPQGTLNMTVDSDLEVIVPAGSNVGESPVLIDTDLEGKAADATIRIAKTETGTLRLELGDGGMATLTVDLQQGSQDITVTTPDGSMKLKGQPVDPSSESFTVPIRPTSCDQ